MSALRPCCHAGAGGALAGAAVVACGAAGNAVWAHPDKTLMATKALKIALFFIIKKSPFTGLVWRSVAIQPGILTAVMVRPERVNTHGAVAGGPDCTAAGTVRRIRTAWACITFLPSTRQKKSSRAVGTAWLDLQRI